MTSQECAEVLAMIRAAILEERERVAKAAGMAAGACYEECHTPAEMLAAFARRLRQGEEK